MTMLEDAEAIRACIASLVHGIDGKRWAELDQLSDVAETDYTSLFGGEVQRRSSSEIIAGWRKLLTPLTATQHLLGPIDVQISGDSAKAQCHIRAYHYLVRPSGTQEWILAGHYRFALEKSAAGWKINGITLQVLYQSGELGLLQQAAEISAGAES